LFDRLVSVEREKVIKLKKCIASVTGRSTDRILRKLTGFIVLGAIIRVDKKNGLAMAKALGNGLPLASWLQHIKKYR